MRSVLNLDVLHQVAFEADASTQCSLALVCVDLSRIVTPLLYRHICVGPRRRTLLVRTLSRRREIAALVRSLVFEDGRSWNRVSGVKWDLSLSFMIGLVKLVVPGEVEFSTGSWAGVHFRLRSFTALGRMTEGLAEFLFRQYDLEELILSEAFGVAIPSEFAPNLRRLCARPADASRIVEGRPVSDIWLSASAPRVIFLETQEAFALLRGTVKVTRMRLLVDQLLALSGREFVSSLNGVEEIIVDEDFLWPQYGSSPLKAMGVLDVIGDSEKFPRLSRLGVVASISLLEEDGAALHAAVSSECKNVRLFHLCATGGCLTWGLSAAGSVQRTSLRREDDHFFDAVSLFGPSCCTQAFGSERARTFYVSLFGTYISCLIIRRVFLISLVLHVNLMSQ
ncbi:hypothetical protein B0H11DRAFT_644920 [Mycena galericulata]|nr:hypothetical protein B0H11DRAFT_644920 [Mycena galericulata]